ncbi:MAG: heavy-metal-associated domain-containing protein [Phycisphaerales bacterium]
MALQLVRRAHAVAALTFSTLLLVGCATPGNHPGEETVYEENPINHTVSPEDIAGAKSTAPVLANAVTLYVNGLGCPLCASNIDRQLVRVKGVKAVAVDLSVGKVTLGLEPGQPHPSPARLGDAVEDAGFTLVKIEQH